MTEHVCDPANADCAAYAHYAIPENREPGPGPARRRPVLPEETRRRIREKAAKLRAERPDYPDSPEQIEEQRQFTAAMYEPQMRAIAALEPDARYFAVGVPGRVVTRTMEVGTAVLIDLDSDGEPVGVEILGRCDEHVS